MSRSSFPEETSKTRADSLNDGLGVAFGPEPTSPGAGVNKPQMPGYQIGDLLGRGSYGEVWSAREENTGIEVAIKFFTYGTGREWQQLQDEVKRLSQLQTDSGIVPLKKVEPGADSPYYVMACAEKGCLARRLAHGQLPLAEALRLFRQVCQTLAYVHAKGIRHCDLKPGNVLLDARGRALVADFGQAQLASDVAPALGTFFYMAPEQAALDGQVADTRWDVYALGALFYAMVGRPPRDDPGVRAELPQVADLPSRLGGYRTWVEQTPPPRGHRRVPGMDRSLAQVIDRCLEVDPGKRWHDAGAVLEALDQRERHVRLRHARRFALVTPLVLLLAMACIGFLVLTPIGKKVRESQDAQLQQVLKRNQYLAQLVGDDVAKKLRARIAVVEQMANTEAMLKALQAGQRQELLRLLEQHHHERLFTSMWVTDARGTILAISPKTSLPQRNWTRCDWFKGRGEQKDDRGNEPVGKTYHSQPYVSQVETRPLVVAVSSHVKDPRTAKVLGLVSASIDLGTIQKWFEELNLPHSFAVLLNERGHYLFHQKTGRIKPSEDRGPKTFDAALLQQVHQDTGIMKGRITDPIDGGSYYASYATLPDNSGWTVLIQHKEAEPERLLENLSQILIAAGLVALAVFAVIIPALWGWHPLDAPARTAGPWVTACVRLPLLTLPTLVDPPPLRPRSRRAPRYRPNLP
jgi:serine/threonine protein kinase